MNYAAPSGLGNNTARTTYGDGGATTRTTGMSMPGGNDQLLEFFKKLARQRLQPQGPPAAAPPGPRMGGSGLRSQVKERYTPQPTNTGVDERTITPAAFGRRTMNSHGQFGLEVDPGNVPVAYADKIHGGFYGNVGNWDSSNPQIAGERSGWGEGPRGGGYVPTASGAAGAPPAGPAIDDESWRARAFAAQNPYASGLMDRFQVQDE